MTNAIPIHIPSQNCYLEFTPDKRHQSFVKTIFCLRENGALAGKNNSIFGNSSFTMMFIYPKTKDKLADTPFVKFHHPSSKMTARKKEFKGWVFGIRFHTLQEAAFNTIPQHLLQDCIDKQSDYLVHKNNTLLAIPEIFDALLDFILQHRSENPKIQKESNALKKIAREIRKESLPNVEKLARQTGVTPRTLHRLVKGRTGLPLKQYLTLKRGHASLRDLIVSDRNLADIAYGNGYSDQSHFNRDINRITGSTPGRLANRWAGHLSKNVRFIQDAGDEHPLKMALWIE